MTKIIEIERGIPIPTNRIYPFPKMQIGDSFLCGNDMDSQAIRNSACRYGKRKNKKFVVRKVKEGYRVWRVK